MNPNPGSSLWPGTAKINMTNMMKTQVASQNLAARLAAMEVGQEIKITLPVSAPEERFTEVTE